MFRRVLYLYAGIVLIIAALFIYFLFFQLNTFKAVPTQVSKPPSIQVSPINYTVKNDTYLSRDINFTFTDFFVPWNESYTFVENAYNSLIFIPTVTNQSNPFEISRPVYLQLFVNSTNLSL